jgi:hypothetical protein
MKVNRFKSSPRLMLTLARIQARFRGLIGRKRVKASYNNKFLQNDPYGNYVVVNSSKIVILFLKFYSD